MGHIGSVVVGMLDALSFSGGLTSGTGSDAANHFHLLLELLVQQSIYKRVDSGIEQDHRESYVKGHSTNVYGCNIH